MNPRLIRIGWFILTVLLVVFDFLVCFKFPSRISIGLAVFLALGWLIIMIRFKRILDPHYDSIDNISKK